MLKVAKADLKASGITKEEALEAGMYSVKDASTIFDDFKPYPALIIPYIDPWTGEPMTFERDGELIDFCRVRYYEVVNPKQGFGKKRKALRYSQPKNSGVHPYFPVTDGIDWREVAEDTSIPVMITEGEKKSLSACLAGIPTIGLGGVYNFTHDGELLPEMDFMDWSGRTVYVCYDSDAGDNSKIQVAEGRLATELSMKRSANVFLVRLPDLPGGAKMGVDDFIVKEGDDALFDLLDKAPEIRKIDREVLRLNGEAAWIEKEGLVLDLRTDTWLKKSDFVKGSEFSARKITVPTDKNKVKTISIADAWLTHPHARRYADTTFNPGTMDKAIPLPGGGVAYNRFRGLSGSEGDVAPFFKLYDYLMSRTDEFDHDLLWKIQCYKIQNLGADIGLGIMLLGPQGGGKSLYCKIISEMVKPYDTVISSNMLGSDYNGWIETSLVVVMTEAKSRDIKFNMDTLKTYITDRRQPMNEKYRANRQVDNWALYYFNSNQRSAGAFPDDDRRMIIIGCPDTHPKGDDFYTDIVAWYKNNGPAKLLNWMQNYDLEGWEPPRKAPETREKRMAYYASLSPVEKIGDAMLKADDNLVAQWINTAMNWAVSDQVGNNPQQIALAAQIQQSMAHIQVRPFYTPEELAMIFPSVSGTLSMGKIRDATPANVLSQALLQCGIDYLRCKDNYDGFYHNGQVRQYLVISNHEKYKDPITQSEFNRQMKEFETYKDWRARAKAALRKTTRKSQRNRK